MVRSYREPYNWWGAHWGPTAAPLSILQLVEAGSLDLHMAALLWLVLERRGSLVVAAEPSLAGKTTTLTALLGFLPPDIKPVYTRGVSETFAFLDETHPASTIILVNEISSHLPSYLWGPAVSQLFAALHKGYALAATMHADTVAELVAQLEAYPLSLPRNAIAEITVVCFLSVERTPSGYRRQIATLWLLDKGGPEGLWCAPLAWRDARGDLTHTDDILVLGRLARRLGLTEQSLSSQWRQHLEHLIGCYEAGRRSEAAVRESVLAFYAESALGR